MFETAFNRDSSANRDSNVFTPSERNTVNSSLRDSDEILVDDQTWTELDGEGLLKKFSANSKFSRHAAMKIFRERSGKRELDARVQLLKFFMEKKELSHKILEALQPLAKADGLKVALFSEIDISLRGNWTRFIRFSPLVLLIALALLPFTSYGFGLLLAFFVFSAFCQKSFYAAMAEFEVLEAEVFSILGAAHELSHCFPSMEKEACLRPIVTPLKEKISWVIMLSTEMRKFRLFSGTPEIDEYANWFFLRNVRRFQKTFPIVAANLEEIRSLADQLGKLELICAFPEFLKNERYSWVDWTDDRSLELVEVRHPIYALSPITISLAKRSALVTGGNASGKSTLLRTVGVNILFARAFGLCFSKRAVLRYSGLKTSIGLHDDLDRGQSFFVKEVARAHESYLAAQSGDAAYLLIDEIFSGTNHMDSISAAGGYLTGMSSICTVIATTHNVELATILHRDFEPFVCAKSNEEFSIRPGVLGATNALEIFCAAGFDGEILRITNAISVALRREFGGGGPFEKHMQF